MGERVFLDTEQEKWERVRFSSWRKKGAGVEKTTKSKRG